jgi:Aspartyl protease
MFCHCANSNRLLACLFTCCSVMATYGKHAKNEIPRPGYANPIKSVIIDALHNSFVQTDSSSCIIPFSLSGKIILVQGRADSMLGNFILDTGAPNLVLNSTYFRSYPVTVSHDENQASITGQGDMIERTVIREFQLGTLHYHRTEADLVSLGHIENTRGVKILGLLGVALFKDCELIIDYGSKVIRLHRIGRKERKSYMHPMLADSSMYTSFPFDLKDNQILVKTNVGKKDLQFVIDYAAESNIIDSRSPDRILEGIAITGRVLLSGSGTRKIEAISGEIPLISVGSLTVRGLPVIITNLENTCFGASNCINGVLGYDFLSRYILVFNFVRRRLYILQ